VALAIYVVLVTAVVILAVRSFDQPVGVHHLSISNIVGQQSSRLEAAVDAATR